MFVSKLNTKYTDNERVKCALYNEINISISADTVTKFLISIMFFVITSHVLEKLSPSTNLILDFSAKTSFNDADCGMNWRATFS